MATNDNSPMPRPPDDDGKGNAPGSLDYAEGLGGVMVFQTGPGELPNVLQYLNFSRKTGRLEIDPKLMLSERGVVCFDNGEIYYARLGPARGMDAIVEMVGFKTTESLFVANEKIAARNVEIPTRDLILQVAVAADRKAADEAADDEQKVEEFIVPDKPGSRIVVRDFKPSTNDIEGEGEGEKTSVGKLTTVMIILAFIAVTVNTIWVASELRDAGQRRRLAREQLAQQGEQEKVDRQRDRIISQMLQSAVDAYRTNRLDEADEGVEAVLVSDPGNEAALTLRRRIAEARSLGELVSLRVAAAAKERLLDGLLQDETFKPEAETAMAVLRDANLLFEQKSYAEAAPEFRRFITLAEALSERRTHYDLAVATRNQLPLAAQGAETAQAAQFATDILRDAVANKERGEREFADGDYTAASNFWRLAGQLYREATTRAKQRVDLLAAQAAYEHLFGEMDEEVLTEFAGEDWRRIKLKEREANQLADQEALAKAAQAWRDAATLLAPVWQAAARQKNARVFAEQMANGRRAVAEENWVLALNALAQVMALDEYRNHEEARDLWRRARHGKLLGQLEAERENENWGRVKTVADEILALAPRDEIATRALATAANMLLPRIEFEFFANGELLDHADVKVHGDQAVREGALAFKLVPDARYTFEINPPPNGDTYYDSVKLNYLANQPGRQTIAIRLQVVTRPEIGKPWTVPGLRMPIVPIKPGTFQMGGNLRGEERPVHAVTISRPMWMATTETTNAQYRYFLADARYDGENHARNAYLRHFAGNTDVPAADDYPVVFVSWENAQAFCRWLTEREARSGRLPENYVYRLPTEAEWEYACRAGSNDDFPGNPMGLAWHGNRSANNAQVATLMANPWGLYDMHGNVWELCHDWYAPYDAESVVDPVGPAGGQFKVLRGGSWRDSIDLCRASYRSQIPAVEPRNNVGFRIVLAPPLAAAE